MKTKELTYKVTTTNGTERELHFIETRTGKGSNSRIYISVERDGDGDFTLIDVLSTRYDKDYNFQIACQDYIARYYGEALTGFERIGIVFE